MLLLKEGSAKIFAQAADVSAELWRQAFGESWKNFDYYRLLEQTMPLGFIYQYLVLYDQNGDADGLQPLILVTQDLGVSMSGFLARLIRGLQSFSGRFLQARMLIAGCLVGDAHLGVSTSGSRRAIARRLAEALRSYAEQERVGLVTVKDFPPAHRLQLDAIVASGYTRLPGYPSLQLALTFATFEEYMKGHLSKVTRKNLRRKFRKAASAQPRIELEVLPECSAVIDEIYPLYLEVARRAKVTFETFTPEYFLEAARQMPGRFRYFIWRQAGTAVAFSFCAIWGDTIYDNDIGLDYRVAHDLNLYHVTFRDIVEWALKHQLRRYVTAPFSYEPKLHLGLEFVPHDLYVRHTSSLLNSMVRHFAPFFSPARTDITLRRHFKSDSTDE